MKTQCLTRVLWLLVLSVVLGLSLPAHANSDTPPELNDARTDLEKAWNPAGDPPSVADRTKLLKDALDLLKQAAASGVYLHDIQMTRKYINAALYELKKGDPDNKATDLIHDAVSQIRGIT